MSMAKSHGGSVIQRGYEIEQRPPECISLDFSEVTSTFCPTRRRIFISRILGVPGKTNKNMALGSIEHASASIVFKKVKAAQLKRIEMCRVAIELEGIASTDENITAALWSENNLENIEKYCFDAELSYQTVIPEFIATARRFLLAEANRLKQPGIFTDDFPGMVAIEDYIDGSALGMNKGKIDALIRLSDDTIIICDMKRKSYGDNLDGKTQIAGYALAMEKEYHIPISVGCLAFSSTLSDNGTEPTREIFAIDNNLRNEFMSRRDQAIQIASGKFLPPFPSNEEWKCKNCEVRKPCHSIPMNGESNG